MTHTQPVRLTTMAEQDVLAWYQLRATRAGLQRARPEKSLERTKPDSPATQAKIRKPQLLYPND
jgi:hypothetical protein